MAINLESNRQKVSILNYGAGNVRSLLNAVSKCGFQYDFVQTAQDIEDAKILIFPGVGSFGFVMESLKTNKYDAALRQYISSGRPFLGICVGMQVLFEGSQENPEVPGLGILPGRIKRFNASNKTVPCIGWNEAVLVHTNEAKVTIRQKKQNLLSMVSSSGDIYPKFYFIHSYYIPYLSGSSNLTYGDHAIAASLYKDEKYIGAIACDNFLACQFHPEKSGAAGLRLIEQFLLSSSNQDLAVLAWSPATVLPQTLLGSLTRRIIACLDVRNDDNGNLVVTKGNQYDVRENSEVRNLGEPVELAKRYYEEGADEICFLNITSFRSCPAKDLPMIKVLKEASKYVFVPMTVGGGIRDYIEPDGSKVSALQIAGMYFAAGADKISLGSDAVFAAERYFRNGKILDGTSTIEQISRNYGCQAVVVSVDPKRCYVKNTEDTNHFCIETINSGPDGEKFAWYQCTVKGGREIRDLDAHQLVEAAQALGAGEILLNCMDEDGLKNGFDIPFIKSIVEISSIPVIASSGAGIPEHFESVFKETGCDAALAAGIFHRRTCSITDVKNYLKSKNLVVR